MQAESQFSEEQFAGVYPAGMENHHWIYARSVFVKRILQRFVSRRTSILEIGCGSGIVLDCLAKAGLNCRGVELGTPRLLSSVEKLAWTGISFQSLDPSYRETVKVVLLLDVVEHIREPSVFLREIGDSMPKLESVVITVPARRELWSNYDDYFGHFHRYNRKDFSSLLEESGYEIVETGYFFHTLYLPMRLMSGLSLKRRVSNSVPKPAWVHRLIAYFHLADSLLLPRWLIGGSLYGVARKRRANHN